MSTLDYLKASTLICYSASDTGTGRCRLPTALFHSLNLRMGYILELKVDDLRVLCTAWPDTSDSLSANQISIDDSVYITSSSAGDSSGITSSIPFSGQCSLIKYFLARISSSIHVIKQRGHKISLPMLMGLPLCQSCRITPNVELGRRVSICVTAVGPGEVSIAGLNTIVVNARPKRPQPLSTRSNPPILDSAASESSTRIIGQPTCCTHVVREIIRTVIRPSVSSPRGLQCHGVLLLGSPGVGKTFAVKAVQKEVASWCVVIIKEVSLSDILATSDPTKELDAIFRPLESDDDDDDYDGLPVMITYIIDEIDALGKPGSDTDLQVVVKEYLCRWLDEQSSTVSSSAKERKSTTSTSNSGSKKSKRSHCILATTNCSADVDIRLRRGGRLEREIDVMISTYDREILLCALIQHVLMVILPVRFTRDGAAAKVAKAAAKIVSLRTGGYVAADLVALTSEVSKGMLACIHAKSEEKLVTDESAGMDIADISIEVDSSPLTLIHILDLFTVAAKSIQPSSLRGATIKIPNLSYDDVIGHEAIKQSLRRILSFCSSDVETKKRAQKFGLDQPGGALLYGPPGNSKTRMIMAVASTHALPVISLSSADIYAPYVGDAEAEIRKAFRLARQAAPCVLFLDEIDAIVTDRASQDNSGGGVSVEARVLATLLTEMDGIDGRAGVIVLGATNRLDSIDAALLRKGRFHHLLHVKNPDAETAKLLLCYFASKCSMITPERVDEMAGTLRWGLSGAEIENVVREENMNLMRKLVPW